MSWFKNVVKAVTGIAIGAGKQAAINAGVQAIEDLTKAADNVIRESYTGLQPSEVHAAEDAALKSIEVALQAMETLSISLHYRGKLTSDEIAKMRELIK